MSVNDSVGGRLDRRPRTVIVGAGFGGLWAARTLAGTETDVLVIDRHNYHTFLPLLYQVAAAELEPEQIAYPVRAIFRRHANLRFVMGEVEGVDLDGKRVRLRGGASIPYDYLILAGGSVTNFFGLKSVAEHALPIKDLADAVRLRSYILSLFERAASENDPERRRALLTFVVVGGGPTGVEFAATLAELIWGVLSLDFPELDVAEAKVLLLEATGSLLPALPPELGAYTQRALERKGVEVRLNTAVTGATAEAVFVAGAPPIPAHTLVWTAGVRASELADQLGVRQGRGGRVVVTPFLNLPGREEVYAVGDMAYVEDGAGRPVPQVAPAAIQEGEAAARNILRRLRGEAPEPFRYRDRGTMVTIGRNTGVARVWGRTVRGFPAWALWLAVHLVKLIGFRNRLFVLGNWAWNYIFFDRATRLILSDPERGDRTPAANS